MTLPGQRGCLKCGVPIVIARQPDGTPIPLDLRAPVYRYDVDLAGERVATRDAGAYVTHFATCTDPTHFSKRGRK